MVSALWKLVVLSATLAAAQAGKPARIVSTTLVTDEIASALVETSRIAALSRFAADPVTSNAARVAGQVKRFVDRGPEEIVALNPDVILATRYSKVDLKGLIRSAGIPYHELKEFRTIKDVESNVRVVAKAVGEDLRGEELIRQMYTKLEAAGRLVPIERRSWRVLYLAPGEWTAGASTSVHEIFSHAGLRNAAAESGVHGNVKISPETVIRMNPEVIVIRTGYEVDRDYAEYLAQDARFTTITAIRSRRIVSVPARYIHTTSHFIGDAALELARRIQALP